MFRLFTASVGEKSPDKSLQLSSERTPENHLTIDYRLSSHQYGTKVEMEQSNLKSEEMFSLMESVWDRLSAIWPGTLKLAHNHAVNTEVHKFRLALLLPARYGGRSSKK